MDFFQQVNFCKRFKWFIVPASVKIPPPEVSCSSEPPRHKHHKRKPQTSAKHPIQKPCINDIKYLCFSAATAKRCNYVSFNKITTPVMYYGKIYNFYF